MKVALFFLGRGPIIRFWGTLYTPGFLAGAQNDPLRKNIHPCPWAKSCRMGKRCFKCHNSPLTPRVTLWPKPSICYRLRPFLRAEKCHCCFARELILLFSNGHSTSKYSGSQVAENTLELDSFCQFLLTKSQRCRQKMAVNQR